MLLSKNFQLNYYFDCHEPLYNILKLCDQRPSIKAVTNMNIAQIRQNQLFDTYIMAVDR